MSNREQTAQPDTQTHCTIVRNFFCSLLRLILHPYAKYIIIIIKLYCDWIVCKYHPKMACDPIRANRYSSLRWICSSIYISVHFDQSHPMILVSIVLAQWCHCLDHPFVQMLWMFHTFVRLFSIHLNCVMDRNQRIQIENSMNSHQHGKHLKIKQNNLHSCMSLTI